MTFRVEISLRAQVETAQVLLWIAEHEERPLEAVRWLDGLDRAIQSLEENPKRFPPAPESVGLGKDVRQLLHHSHRILFAVEGDLVEVLHIRHGAMRRLGPEDL